MARITIDTCVVGETWFKSIAQELMSTRTVIFVRGRDKISSEEIDKCTKLFELYNLVSKQGRLITLNAPEANDEVEKIEKHSVWARSECCDDPHVFAIARKNGVKFVFTKDKRLAKCRCIMKKVIDKSYTQFSIVCSDQSYKAQKERILR